MLANQQRIEQHIELLSQFTSTPGAGVTRLTYSKEDLNARNYIKEQMLKYGLTVSEDGFGNIFGKLDGTIPNAPSVIVGSHFDSVPNGGAFDGTAGVIIGLEVAALFQENNCQPAYPLEIIALVEEEGSRWGGGLMGSRGMMGLLTNEDFKVLADKDGVLAEDAMISIGLDPSKEKFRDPKTIKAFLELHIEQGPILEEKDIPIGIVEAIVGLTQLEVTIQGKAGHAGTTPMNRRSDALVAAAEIIAAFPKLAIEEGNGTVITTGQLQVFPNGSNVIPDKVVFSVDIRSGKEQHVQNAVEKVEELIASKQTTDILTSTEQLLYISPKEMDQHIQSIFKETSNDLVIPYCSINSGAGHDAMVFSDFTACGMIFIPSKDGLSHCPEEWSDGSHLASGANIVFQTALKLTEGNK
ncbi:Zn-dependent hydrolase [Psychrobacillus lasiicapitis]|uniref:Zn-dependent hydrolase n=1 Tax=Psychrobacillus lasiicapitis TaxID=1636719 RepID=A0A544T5C0_9BACI|nr:Zn-dependent hydrolase [Psychrobacillus lasiicapitis]TQR12629.1 Zn-dependent hydrolase [Psychrobacillus lasiicapitis]GGA39660.1 Zn-dependent hydrolase [Psychrobacillus lasiicapitis]